MEAAPPKGVTKDVTKVTFVFLGERQDCVLRTQISADTALYVEKWSHKKMIGDTHFYNTTRAFLNLN